MVALFRNFFLFWLSVVNTTSWFFLYLMAGRLPLLFFFLVNLGITAWLGMQILKHFKVWPYNTKPMPSPGVQPPR